MSKIYKMKRSAQSKSSWGKKKYKTNKEYSFAGNKIPTTIRLNRDGGNRLIIPAVRSCTLISNAAFTSGGNFGALSFKLSDLPNYTEFTNLYDEYRFKAVKIMFIPTMNVATANATAGTTAGFVPVPALYTWIDNDDNTAPTTLSQGQQFQTFKAHGLLNVMRTRTVVPECSTALYAGSFTSYGQQKNQWIDNNSPGVIHFGLKFALINPANQGNFDVQLTYYLEFRKLT